MDGQPHEIEMMTMNEADELIIGAESMSDLPAIGDTIIGDREADIGVLLVHGFSGTNLEMTYIGNYLALQGYRVLMPLLPGHGTTSHDLAIIDENDWVKKLENSYSLLKNEVAGREIFYIGHSLGGTLGIIMASKLDLIGLICLASPVRYPFFIRLGASLVQNIPLRVPYEEFEFYNEDLYDHPGVKNFVETYGKVPLRSLGVLFSALSDAYEILSEITIPTCLIYSTLDNTVPPYHVDLIRDKIGSEDLEVHWLFRSYHIMVIDEDRQLIVRKLDGFINRIVKNQKSNLNKSLIDETT